VAAAAVSLSEKRWVQRTAAAPPSAPPPRLTPQEIFYQLAGDMVLETIERGARKAVRIPEGHIFCLPGRIPHSPQRLAGTVGLVIERDRRLDEIDGMRWCALFELPECRLRLMGAVVNALAVGCCRPRSRSFAELVHPQVRPRRRHDARAVRGVVPLHRPGGAAEARH
jgi:hypothetical protein